MKFKNWCLFSERGNYNRNVIKQRYKVIIMRALQLIAMMGEYMRE